jgi:hypothetical protein
MQSKKQQVLRLERALFGAFSLRMTPDISVSGRDGAGGINEGAELVGVFLANRELDTGDDLDAARIEEADGVSDIVGVQTSADNDGLLLLDTVHHGQSGLPVEGLTGSPAGSD